ncbi:unnamed protein product [Owenia fusiformis]|uniref:Uncharacterized protein n=1 Tax=Owenia fusiformis TaxID=6347 RepID=A0A8J1TCW2_OWEFU|nr:unnamed protein product [Owenia fusiformis]
MATLAKYVEKAVAGAYLFLGGIKIVALTSISPVIRDTFTTQFRDFAQVFPLAKLGYIPETQCFLATIGFVETFLGLLLMFGDGGVKQLAAKGLMVIMLGAIWTLAHIDPPQLIVPISFLGGLIWIHNNAEKKDNKRL